MWFTPTKLVEFEANWAGSGILVSKLYRTKTASTMFGNYIRNLQPELVAAICDYLGVWDSRGIQITFCGTSIATSVRSVYGPTNVGKICQDHPPGCRCPFREVVKISCLKDDTVIVRGNLWGCNYKPIPLGKDLIQTFRAPPELFRSLLCV